MKISLFFLMYFFSGTVTAAKESALHVPPHDWVQMGNCYESARRPAESRGIVATAFHGAPSLSTRRAHDNVATSVSSAA